MAPIGGSIGKGLGPFIDRLVVDHTEYPKLFDANLRIVP